MRDSLPDTPSTHAVVEAVEVGLSDGFADALATERRLVISLHHTDAARRKIEDFLAQNAEA